MIASDSLALKALAVGLVAVVLRFVIAYVTSPLKAFPGPLVARFTDLWRFWDYMACTHTNNHRQLHEKYGPAVRIGPNLVTLNDPELIREVYSTRGDFHKSNFYEVADASSQGQRLENVFSTRSNVFHARYLKPYQKFFSMSTILGKEHLADNMARVFCEQLETRFVDGDNGNKTCDLADWIEYAAWDLDWEMTFSQDMGFLKSGTDVDGMIHTGEMVMRYLGCVGQIPWLDRLLGKNPYCPIKFATFEGCAFYCFQRVMERIQSGKTGQGDFLDNFLEAKETHPDIVSDNEVVSYLMMNVLAGADTTAIEIKSITWHLLSNPEAHKKLVSELSSVALSFPPKYEETKDLPYLNAVIKEAMRLHPVISGVLERIVPSSGLTLPDGRVIPAGTKVGMNPWVVHRSEQTFGPEPDTFRPERWMKGPDEPQEKFDMRLKKMKDADLSFGSGNRICVGRNMAMVEMHKVISTLFSRYDIKLADPAKKWSVRYWWFTFVDDIDVKISRRAGVPSLA
ncbi:cytochrome P450 [Emericellopsis atlantica]|uniref:Cytochrome P450 n=1 Tax=Emericellopsis atlantica TaxID=2614577 RepID=A0A9P7ZVJ6_9HYPO|nr:cytochrome P450 [Emericellopsis atlantica]KAG9259119.1 cytochrome P450 [Emericellopsis atlantica]